ncbi:MAG: hypothetical protein Q9169_002692 [Polycauliona sp. 2 TL-2023]
MDLTTLEHIELPPTADFHSHLRQDSMMEFVTPYIEKGGCDTALVMPNLQPPITQVSQAGAYHEALSQIAPKIKFLMTLYLHPTVTPDVIAEAAQSDVVYGVKLYPAGVTTNSQDGVLDIEQYYPVFEAMQEHDLVLNLHGETPDVEVLQAEAAFVPTLQRLHAAFPRLRIVLEHVSTAKGIEAVRQCGPTVAATITAHHLFITTENAEQDVYNFCKPIAKTMEDRIALLRAAVDGSGKFFFGSDSAPHPVQSKKQTNAAAGCFTQGWVSVLVIDALKQAIEMGWISNHKITQETLEGFLSTYGRKFYKLAELRDYPGRRIRLERSDEIIPKSIVSPDGAIEVVPFRRGEQVMSLSWTEGS